MNILYVSKLSGNLFSGPNYSVPAQIKAQAKYDNVFWYNLNQMKRPEWMKDGVECKNMLDFPSARLDDLPEPFNNPDIAIVQQIYHFPFCSLISDLQRKRIPYIIVPRSSLTTQAQNKKKWKKRIGNFLYFSRMIRRAAAIQYLTEEEKVESCGQWKIKSFVIPNGIDKKDKIKVQFSTDKINATYIGRYEIYQKGLDMMLDAIGAEQDLLRENGFVLNMYGHNQENTVDQLVQKIDEKRIGDIVKIHGTVFGDEKEKILLETDVFVMTSRFEGLPMGMIEALSYGLPCVATIGTNLAKEIEEYDAGWAADNDVSSIRTALCEMVAQKNELKVKSKNAVDLADTYSWDKIAQRSHGIYIDLLTK